MTFGETEAQCTKPAMVGAQDLFSAVAEKIVGADPETLRW